MQAVLDWSHALLAGPERALLRRLSLFVGGFTLDSAEAVCAGDPLAPADVLGLLSDLVDKSFVTVSRADPARARYGLLETVGHYARAKLLESGEAEQIRQRHDLYFLGLAEQAAGHCRAGPTRAAGSG